MEGAGKDDLNSVSEADDSTNCDRPLLLSNWSFEEKIDRRNFYEKKASRLNYNLSERENILHEDCAQRLDKEMSDDKKLVAPQKPQDEIKNTFQNKTQNTKSERNSTDLNESTSMQGFVAAQREKAMTSRMVDRGSSGRRWRKRRFSREKEIDVKQEKEEDLDKGSDPANVIKK